MVPGYESAPKYIIAQKLDIDGKRVIWNLHLQFYYFYGSIYCNNKEL